MYLKIHFLLDMEHSMREMQNFLTTLPSVKAQFEV
jgi:hypothetical protein